MSKSYVEKTNQGFNIINLTMAEIKLIHDSLLLNASTPIICNVQEGQRTIIAQPNPVVIFCNATENCDVKTGILNKIEKEVPETKWIAIQQPTIYPCANNNTITVTQE